MSAASQRHSPLAGVILFAKENHPRTPKRTQGAGRPLTLVPFSSNHPSGTHVRATARQSRVSIGFRLGLRLYPLSRWCSAVSFPSATFLRRGVSDKTHMSFRTRYAAAAERNKKHTKSSEAPAPPYCSQKVGFPRQSGGQGACPLCFSGGRAGGGLFQKRPSLANRQRASALLICRAALGTLL